jgi:hypothetical protein
LGHPPWAATDYRAILNLDVTRASKLAFIPGMLIVVVTEVTVF